MEGLVKVENNIITQQPSSVLHGKYVGLFFGAQWCPHCKLFLQPLVTFYNFVKPTNAMEIVYVPYDRNEEEYKNMASSMPWYTLPYKNYGYLCKRYDIKNLPWFTVVSPDNSIFLDNAGNQVKDVKSVEDPFIQSVKAKTAISPMTDDERLAFLFF